MDYAKKLDAVFSRGVQSHRDLELITEGARVHVRARHFQTNPNEHSVERAELPNDMTGVVGRLRMGNDVFTIKDGKLFKAGETEPVGELLKGYKVKFASGQTADLMTESRVLLQWKGTDNQTHNLIGLGPGGPTDFGYQAGGLTDVTQIQKEAQEAINKAREHDQKYFEDRPYLTKSLGSKILGDAEKVMKNIEGSLQKTKDDLDECMAVLFGEGSYDSHSIPNGFNQELFKDSLVRPGRYTNVSTESLNSKAGLVQVMLHNMGSTSRSVGELAQEMSGFQQQLADSCETAVVTVATAGAGAYFAGAARLGQMSKGAATLWQLGSGIGFGGTASLISAKGSDVNAFLHGDGTNLRNHMLAGSIKGLSMSVPGALGTFRMTPGAAGATQTVLTRGQMIRQGLVATGKTALDSGFQTTMFAAADWVKEGAHAEDAGKYFSTSKLLTGTGAMFLATGGGHALGHLSDRVGVKLTNMIGATERGQALLQSRAGKLIFGAKFNNVTGHATLGALETSINKETGQAAKWVLKEGQQTIAGNVINQMSNAYAFGALGSYEDSVKAEKSRVSNLLGFEDADLASTSSPMFSWSAVTGSMHESGMGALAAAGPMAYCSHKVSEHFHNKLESADKQRARFERFVGGERARIETMQREARIERFLGPPAQEFRQQQQERRLVRNSQTSPISGMGESPLPGGILQPHSKPMMETGSLKTTTGQRLLPGAMLRPGQEFQDARSGIKIKIEGSQPVSQQVVLDFLHAADKLKEFHGVRPSELVVEHNPDNAATGGQSGYTVRVNTAQMEGHKAEFIYNHETGHVMDRENIRHFHDPKIQELYKAALVADIKSEKMNKAMQDAYGISPEQAKKMQDQMAFLAMQGKDVFEVDHSKTDQNMMYRLARNEVFAEAHRFHAINQQRIAKGEKPLSLEQMAAAHQLSGDPKRAKLMAAMSNSMRLLEEQVFIPVEAQRERARQAAGDPRKSGPQHRDSLDALARKFEQQSKMQNEKSFNDSTRAIDNFDKEGYKKARQQLYETLRDLPAEGHNNEARVKGLEQAHRLAEDLMKRSQGKDLRDGVAVLSLAAERELAGHGITVASQARQGMEQATHAESRIDTGSKGGAKEPARRDTERKEPVAVHGPAKVEPAPSSAIEQVRQAHELGREAYKPVAERVQQNIREASDLAAKIRSSEALDRAKVKEQWNELTKNDPSLKKSDSYFEKAPKEGMVSALENRANELQSLENTFGQQSPASIPAVAAPVSASNVHDGLTKLQGIVGKESAGELKRAAEKLKPISELETAARNESDPLGTLYRAVKGTAAGSEGIKAFDAKVEKLLGPKGLIKDLLARDVKSGRLALSTSERALLESKLKQITESEKAVPKIHDGSKDKLSLPGLYGKDQSPKVEITSAHPEGTPDAVIRRASEESARKAAAALPPSQQDAASAFFGNSPERARVFGSAQAENGNALLFRFQKPNKENFAKAFFQEVGPDGNKIGPEWHITFNVERKGNLVQIKYKLSGGKEVTVYTNDRELKPHLNSEGKPIARDAALEGRTPIDRAKVRYAGDGQEIPSLRESIDRISSELSARLPDNTGFRRFNSANPADPGPKDIRTLWAFSKHLLRSTGHTENLMPARQGQKEAGDHGSPVKPTASAQSQQQQAQQQAAVDHARKAKSEDAQFKRRQILDAQATAIAAEQAKKPAVEQIAQQQQPDMPRRVEQLRTSTESSDNINWGQVEPSEKPALSEKAVGEHSAELEGMPIAAQQSAGGAAAAGQQSPAPPGKGGEQEHLPSSKAPAQQPGPTAPQDPQPNQIAQQHQTSQSARQEPSPQPDPATNQQHASPPQPPSTSASLSTLVPEHNPGLINNGAMFEPSGASVVGKSTEIRSIDLSTAREEFRRPNIELNVRHYSDGVEISIPSRVSGEYGWNEPRDIRIFKVAGKDFGLIRDRGWFYIHDANVAGSVGDVKGHVTITNPAEKVAIDRVLIPLLSDAINGVKGSQADSLGLIGLISGAKIKDPLYREAAHIEDQSLRLPRESAVGPLGQDAKDYTIYARSHTDMEKAAKIIDTYLQAHGLGLDPSIKTGNSSDFVRLPQSNRVSVDRDKWPVAQLKEGIWKPLHEERIRVLHEKLEEHLGPDGRLNETGMQRAARSLQTERQNLRYSEDGRLQLKERCGASIENDLGKVIRDKYRNLSMDLGVELVAWNGRLTEEGLRRLARDAGIAEGQVMHDEQGKLMFFSSDDVPLHDEGKLYVDEALAVKEGDKRTGRPALYALYASVNEGRSLELRDPAHYVAMQEAAYVQKSLLPETSRQGDSALGSTKLEGPHLDELIANAKHAPNYEAAKAWLDAAILIHTLDRLQKAQESTGGTELAEPQQSKQGAEDFASLKAKLLDAIGAESHPQNPTIHQIEDFPAHIDGINLSWSRTTKAEQTIRWLEGFVDQFLIGDYVSAYQRAKNSESHPVRVEVLPRDVVLKSSEIDPRVVSPQQASDALKKHIGEMSRLASAYPANFLEVNRPQEYVVVEPRTVLQLASGREVGLMEPARTVHGEALTNEEREELKYILQSEVCTNLRREHAIIMAEEMAHVRQMDNNYVVMSSVFAKLIENNGILRQPGDPLFQTGRLNPDNHNIGYRPHETVEMEIPTLFYEAGMPANLTKELFGRHAERGPVLDFISKDSESKVR